MSMNRIDKDAAPQLQSLSMSTDSVEESIDEHSILEESAKHAIQLWLDQFGASLFSVESRKWFALQERKKTLASKR